MSQPKVFQDQLFACLEASCLAEGGDGDAGLICREWKAAADAFEAWLKRNDNTWWTRTDRDTCVTFHNNQEAIYFSPTKDGLHLISVFDTMIWDL